MIQETKDTTQPENQTQDILVDPAELVLILSTLTTSTPRIPTMIPSMTAKISYEQITWISPYKAPEGTSTRELMQGVEPLVTTGLFQVISEDSDTLTVFTSLLSHAGVAIGIEGAMSIPQSSIQSRRPMYFIEGGEEPEDDEDDEDEGPPPLGSPVPYFQNDRFRNN
jgi:hypothetical protein